MSFSSRFVRTAPDPILRIFSHGRILFRNPSPRRSCKSSSSPSCGSVGNRFDNKKKTWRSPCFFASIDLLFYDPHADKQNRRDCDRENSRYRNGKIPRRGRHRVQIPVKAGRQRFDKGSCRERRRSRTTAPFSARRKASSPVIPSDYSFKNAAAAFSTPSFGPMAASAGGAAKQIFAAAMTSSIVTFAIEESTSSADLTSPVIR